MLGTVNKDGFKSTARHCGSQWGQSQPRKEIRAVAPLLTPDVSLSTLDPLFCRHLWGLAGDEWAGIQQGEKWSAGHGRGLYW